MSTAIELNITKHLGDVKAYVTSINVLHDQHGMIPGNAAMDYVKCHVTLQRDFLPCQTGAADQYL